MEFHIDHPPPVPPWVLVGLSLLALVGYTALVFTSCTWAARDAAERGKSGFLIGLLVFFTWPLGLLFWLAARPSTKLPPIVRRLITRCTQPGCEAYVRKAGKILGASIYLCDAGHEFTVPEE